MNNWKEKSSLEAENESQPCTLLCSYMWFLCCWLFYFLDFSRNFSCSFCRKNSSRWAGRLGELRQEDFEVILHLKLWFKHQHYGQYLERNRTILRLFTHHWFCLKFWAPGGWWWDTEPESPVRWLPDPSVSLLLGKIPDHAFQAKISGWVTSRTDWGVVSVPRAPSPLPAQASFCSCLVAKSCLALATPQTVAHQALRDF